MSSNLIKLGDICKIGSSKRIKRADYVQDGIPFFRSKEIIELSKGNSISTELFISSDQYNQINEKFGSLGSGDILITSVGTLGVAYQVEQAQLPFYFKDGNLTWLSQFSENVNPRWIFYWLNSPEGQQKIDEISIGSTQRAITIVALKSIELQLPHKDEQDRTVQVLDSVTGKIRTNNQTNQTLEQIAQALFKSWFVDFDPVKAKIAALNSLSPWERDGVRAKELANLAAMSIIAAKSPKQLAELKQTKPADYQQLTQTAALFPSAMQDSELGEIPEGWNARPFGGLLEKTIGGDWGKEVLDEKHTEKVRILRGTDLLNVHSGNDSGVPVRYVNKKKLQTRQLQDGDIVIEVSGGSPTQPTGRSLFISQKILNRFAEPAEPASFCRLFRPLSVKLGLLLSCHLTKIYSDGKTWLYQNQSTGISNFQTKVFLEKELVVVSDTDVVDAFIHNARPIFDRIHSGESKKLSALRDTLLPELLSGNCPISTIEEV